MKLAYPVVSPESGGRVKACYGPYEDIFPKLKEMGYEGIELLVQDPERVDTALLDQALEKWELSLAAIGTSPMQSEEKLFLIHPDKACSGEAKERCHSLLKLCARYQVPALIGKYRGQVMDEEGCREKDLEAALAQVCREAKALGVEVLLGPHDQGAGGQGREGGSLSGHLYSGKTPQGRGNDRRLHEAHGQHGFPRLRGWGRGNHHHMHHFFTVRGLFQENVLRAHCGSGRRHDGAGRKYGRPHCPSVYL